MNFYAEKYLNENKVVVELKKVDTFEKRRLLFEALNVDLAESDFIEQAYKFAIECCESLKWIYVYRYFFKFPTKDKQEIF